MALNRPNIEKDIWKELGMSPADMDWSSNEQGDKRIFEEKVKEVLFRYGF